MRTWIVGLMLAALYLPASATTLGEFASALAVPVAAKHSANNWNALKPIKGVKWRDTMLKEAPSAFAQEAASHSMATGVALCWWLERVR